MVGASEFSCIVTVIPNAERIFDRIDIMEFSFAYETEILFCVFFFLFRF